MLRSRQALDKYRIERKIASGGFATVYRAYDTIEGVRVAVKVPHPHLVNRDNLNLFKREVKVHAQLDHPNILPIKYAGFVGEQFVIISPMGSESLEDRLGRRMAVRKTLDLCGQMLEAVSFAHGKRILHSDIKPENFILFPNDQVRLADFGLAKVSYRTMSASGSGTVGYLAPEQALGAPSLASDVFSLGLVFYRMLSGSLPRWPFEWPLVGHDRLRRNVGSEMIALLHRALEVDHRKRYRDARPMLAAFTRARPRSLGDLTRRKRKRQSGENGDTTWKRVRFREFLAQYRTRLQVSSECTRCGGPVSEPMQACPWCGVTIAVHRAETRFPDRCGRCKRGRKLDWRFCPWCYGAGFPEVATRKYSDVRYTSRCTSSGCKDRRLMPFMKYCPSCHRKVKRRWPIPDCSDRCGHCGWGVLREFWSHCPWCSRELRRGHGR